jgi:gluconate 2-dehydrogenase gamma chain
MDSSGASRRQFLQYSGGALGLSWLAGSWPAVVAAAQHGHAMAAADATDRTRFLVLSASQARDVEAITAQIVPSGTLPGAREAGVVYFIDHIHAGHWQARAPELLAGIEDFQQRCAKHHPGVAQFADLGDEEQIGYLRHIERTPFFAGLRFMTLAGLLALPSYGGNRDKLGWKLVGFVDQHAWQPPFGHYDAEYTGFVPYPGTPLAARS